MDISFLAQGLSSNENSPLGNFLIKSFKSKKYNKFTAFVAFASESGIIGLSDHIQKAKINFDDIRFIVGIDQQGTSIEALQALEDLKVNSWVYYTTQRIIFHPKIYVFEGNLNRIVVGSSNLTTPGLFQNVESSVLISFSDNDSKGTELLSSIKNYFDSFYAENDLNIQRLTKELIDDLSNEKLVLHEKDRLKIKQKSKNEINKNKKHSNFNKIKSLFPLIKIQRPSSEFIRKTKNHSKSNDLLSESKDIIRENMVWSKKNLPASDVQYSKKGTNPTGGIRLTQAKFKVKGNKINQTTYFRYELFGNYKWNLISQQPYVEATEIPFNIKIDDKDFGTYHLEVRYKPSGEASQANYTTSISWGLVGESIKGLDFRGKDLFLYRCKLNNREIFEIVIV